MTMDIPIPAELPIRPEDLLILPEDDGRILSLTGGYFLPVGRRRRLLEEDVNVEDEGLADLSGYNCNIIVTYDEDNDADKKIRDTSFTAKPPT